MKHLKNAGIAIIVGLIFGVISIARILIKVIPNLGNEQALNQAISSIMSPAIIIIGLIISILIAIFHFRGYVDLGQKSKNKLLITIGWIMMALLVINTLISNVAYLTSTDPANLTTATVRNTIFVVIFSISLILLGAGLLQVKQKIRLAGTVGILNIITGIIFGIITLIKIPILAQVLSPIGLITFFAGLITAIAMFFKASRQFKE